MGWPLVVKRWCSFMYHREDHIVSIGFVVHLTIKIPSLSLHGIQLFKHHPRSRSPRSGRRVPMPRAITECGSIWAETVFPPAVFYRLFRRFVNVPRIRLSNA